MSLFVRFQTSEISQTFLNEFILSFPQLSRRWWHLPATAQHSTAVLPALCHENSQAILLLAPSHKQTIATPITDLNNKNNEKKQNNPDIPSCWWHLQPPTARNQGTDTHPAPTHLTNTMYAFPANSHAVNAENIASKYKTQALIIFLHLRGLLREPRLT